MYNTVATSLVLVFLSASAAAQELTPPAPRQGYYLGGTLQGVSILSRDEELGALGAMPGMAFSARLGQEVNSWLGLGLRVDYGFARSDRWEASFGGLLLETQLRLWRHLSLEAGVGLGFLGLSDRSKLIDEGKGVAGATYAAGLAYDFFPFYGKGSGGFSVTPSVMLRHLPGDSFRSTMLWVGVEFLWWSGLDRQMLELPEEEAYTRD